MYRFFARKRDKVTCENINVKPRVGQPSKISKNMSDL